MKIAVLGGLGLQGRAAIADLVASVGVEEIVCVDTAADGPARLAGLTDLARVRFVVPEGAIGPALATVLDDVDAVIDLLPQPLMRQAVQAAIATRTPLVTTNYAKSIADLAPAAEQAGVSIMTECGLDPGIDLVLYARAARQFDSISSIDSYCGGIPEPKAMAKPLCYKVSWNFDMVLVSQNRDSVMIEDGKRVAVPAGQQHDNPFIHEIEVAGLGKLEAFPNG
ncbi:saccharopine dehydrogenase family protein, partial [Mesorhizobium sp. M7A.T.Ca.TU.009.01.3.1]